MGESMTPEDKIEAVRTMAKTMVKIDSVEMPEIDPPEQHSPENILNEDKENVQEIMGEYMEDRKVEINDENVEDIDIDGVSEWWEAWCEIREIIDDAFETDVEGGNCATLTELEPGDHMSATNELINFSIDMYASGDLSYITEYPIDAESNSWGMLYEGFPDVDGLDQIQLGREVARSEMIIIINSTRSAAETVDYWQTKLNPTPLIQKNWADIRGVSRQTVNDRVRSAVDSLGE
jgi:hypothetical protein